MNLLQKTIEEFKGYVKEMTHFQEIGALLGWDTATMTPAKGIAQRAEIMGTLSTHTFKMLTSDKVGSYLAELTSEENYPSLDHMTKRMVDEIKKAYDHSKKIPADLYREYAVFRAKAEDVWKEARANSDFAAFAPTLKQMIDYQKQFIELWGYEGHPYNALLEHYESGLTVEKVDQIFSNLRQSLVPLVQKIAASPNKPDSSILERDYDPEKQKEFVLKVIKKLGFDMEAGRLDVSAHPFAQNLNPSDVRLTTRYNRNDLRSALFGAIHESGHGMYEQNVAKDLIGTNLCSGASMSIHESQSRFWENIIGRSKGFWQLFYQDLVLAFPETLQDVPMEDFHRAINAVKPTLIRVEADEVTYNLHIMLRYEIEKQLFAGELEVEQLPEVWNRLFEEYLGITPPNDALGVLQDVHWSFGLFGYFPSYALGNIYAAQFTHAMKQDLPNIDQLVEQGEFAPILQWLVEKIHSKGMLLEPLTLLKEVTGEELNSSYLVSYLEEKYNALYS